MVTVPTYNPIQQSPRAIAPSSVRATPNAFGAGVAQAGGQVGNTITGAALNAFDDMAAAQKMLNVNEAKELDNRFSNEKRELLYGEGGLYTLRGKAAVEAMPGTQKKLLELRSKLSDESSTNQTRDLFGLSSEAKLQGELEKATAFGVKSQIKMMNDTGDARSQVAISDSVAKLGDNNEFYDSLDIVKAEAAERSSRDGETSISAKKRELDATTLLYKSNIEAHLETDDPASARDLLKKGVEQSRIDGNTASELRKALRTSSVVKRSQERTKEILNDPSLDTEAKQNAAARELPSEVVDAVLARLDRRREEFDSQLDERAAASYDRISTDPTLETMVEKLAAADGLPPKERASVRTALLNQYSDSKIDNELKVIEKLDALRKSGADDEAMLNAAKAAHPSIRKEFVAAVRQEIADRKEDIPIRAQTAGEEIVKKGGNIESQLAATSSLPKEIRAAAQAWIRQAHRDTSLSVARRTQEALYNVLGVDLSREEQVALVNTMESDIQEGVMRALDKDRSEKAAQLELRITNIKASASGAIQNGQSVDEWLARNPGDAILLQGDSKAMNVLRAAEKAYINRATFSQDSGNEAFPAFMNKNSVDISNLSDADFNEMKNQVTSDQWNKMITRRKGAKDSVDTDVNKSGSYTAAEKFLSENAPFAFKWGASKQSSKYRDIEIQIRNNVYDKITEYVSINKKQPTDSMLQGWARKFLLPVKDVNDAWYKIFGDDSLQFAGQLSNLSKKQQDDYSVDMEKVNPGFKASVVNYLKNVTTVDVGENDVSSFIAAELFEDGARQREIIAANTPRAPSPPDLSGSIDLGGETTNSTTEGPDALPTSDIDLSAENQQVFPEGVSNTEESAQALVAYKKSIGWKDSDALAQVNAESKGPVLESADKFMGEVIRAVPEVVGDVSEGVVHAFKATMHNFIDLKNQVTELGVKGTSEAITKAKNEALEGLGVIDTPLIERSEVSVPYVTDDEKGVANTEEGTQVLVDDKKDAFQSLEDAFENFSIFSKAEASVSNPRTMMSMHVSKVEGDKIHEDGNDIPTSAYGINMLVHKKVIADLISSTPGAKTIRDVPLPKIKEAALDIFDDGAKKYDSKVYDKLSTAAKFVVLNATYNTGEAFTELAKILVKFEKDDSIENLDAVLSEVRRKGAPGQQAGADNRPIRDLVAAGLIDLDNPEHTAMLQKYLPDNSMVK